MLFHGEIIIIFYAVFSLDTGTVLSEIAGCYLSNELCVSEDGFTCATPQPEKHFTIDGWPCQRWDCPHPHQPSSANTGDNACINDGNNANGTWCYIADPDGPVWQWCWTLCPQLTTHSPKGLKACYDSTTDKVSTPNGNSFGDAPCALAPMIKAYTSNEEWIDYWPDCSYESRSVTHEFPKVPVYPIQEEFKCPSVFWTLVEDNDGLACLRLYKEYAGKYEAKAACKKEDPKATLAVVSMDSGSFSTFLYDSGAMYYDVWLSGEGYPRQIDYDHYPELREEGYPCPIYIQSSSACGCLYYSQYYGVDVTDCDNIMPFVCQIRQKLPCSWSDYTDA